MSETAIQLCILCGAGLVAWWSIKTREDRSEDRAAKERPEAASQGRTFTPATQGRVVGLSRNGGWWE